MSAICLARPLADYVPPRCPLCDTALGDDDGEITLCAHALAVASNGEGPSAERGDGTASLEHPIDDPDGPHVVITYEGNPFNWSWTVLLSWPRARLDELPG